MKPLYRIVIILVIFIIGCETEPAKIIEVSGKVINFGSGSPIQGAEVVLADRMNSGGWSNNSSGTRARIFTNVWGGFNLRLEDETTAYLTVWKDDCTYESPLIFTEGKHENVVLKLKAEAPTQFNFISTFKTNDEHRLDVTLRDDNGNILAVKQFKGTGPFTYHYTGTGDTFVVVTLSFDKDGATKTQVLNPYYLVSFIDNTFTVNY